VFRHYAAVDRKIAQIERHPGEWYVNVSLVKATEGRLRRRKQDCTAVCVLMLDDIGTKATEPPVAPSAIVETSPGNFQYLYFLEPWDVTTDEGRAYFEGCNRAVVAAGYGDKGAMGVSRVFRVPGSINTKPGRDGWAARVSRETWHPERVWELPRLMEEMELEPITRATSPGATFEGELPDIDDPVMPWLEGTGRLGAKHDDWWDIRCPWAHQHTDGVETAGYSPLSQGADPLRRGFHCFHEHCIDKTSADFLAWVAEQGGPDCPVVGLREFNLERLTHLSRDLTPDERIELIESSLPRLDKSRLPDVTYTKPNAAGEFHPTASQLATVPNVLHVAQVYGVQILYNMMHRDIECSLNDATLNTMLHSDASREGFSLLVDGCQRIGIRNRSEIVEAANMIGARHRFHPMEDWIKAVEWDGTSRIGTLARSVDVLDDYRQVWGVYLRRWLLQTVQAVCGWRAPQQVSFVPVLCGPQGCGKTRWIASLVPAEFFSEGIHLDLKMNVRDSISQATRRPVVELGELESTFRKADSGALKAFLARSEDTYRQPYARNDISWPRCTSFIASVNRTDFLVDETGSRRYGGVECESCNPEHGVDMRQVWAEAYVLWKGGEQWFLSTQEDEMRRQHSDHFRSIPEAEIVADAWLRSHEGDEQAMNLVEFCKMIQITPNNQNLSLVRRVLNLHLGTQKRQVKGVRRAWKIPTKPTQMLKLVEK